jgi:hypothetical protein
MHFCNCLIAFLQFPSCINHLCNSIYAIPFEASETKAGEKKAIESSSGSGRVAVETKAGEKTLGTKIGGTCNASLVFKGPSPGASGYLALVLPAEHDGGNKKVPPKTMLCMFLVGRVTNAPTGVAWSFTKPKKDDVYDHTAKTCKTLAELIVSTKATSVARHSPATFVEGIAPATLTGPTAPPRFVSSDSEAVTQAAFIEYASGVAEVVVGWVVKAKGTEIVPLGIGVWTKKQIILAGGGLRFTWLLRLCVPVLGPAASSYL